MTEDANKSFAETILADPNLPTDLIPVDIGPYTPYLSDEALVRLRAAIAASNDDFFVQSDLLPVNQDDDSTRI